MAGVFDITWVFSFALAKASENWYTRKARSLRFSWYQVLPGGGIFSKMIAIPDRKQIGKNIS
jgi:hypothetical protein